MEKEAIDDRLIAKDLGGFEPTSQSEPDRGVWSRLVSNRGTI
jgi:hypothetical protein